MYQFTGASPGSNSAQAYAGSQTTQYSNYAQLYSPQASGHPPAQHDPQFATQSLAYAPAHHYQQVQHHRYAATQHPQFVPSGPYPEGHQVRPAQPGVQLGVQHGSYPSGYSSYDHYQQAMYPQGSYVPDAHHQPILFQHGSQASRGNLAVATYHQEQSYQACYNCGSYEHWAQDCSEQRREIPAGQGKRGPKRQKTSGAPVARNFDCHQSSVQGNGTYPLPGQQPYLPPTGPSMPPAFNQYAHSPPQAAYPPAGVQATPQLKQWNITGLPTPASSYGSQFPSPASPIDNAQQSFSPYQIAQAYPAEHLACLGSVSVPAQEEAHSTAAFNGESETIKPPITSIPSESPPAAGVGEAEEEEDGSWLAELQTLDFPDGDKVTETATHPLPSLLTEADADPGYTSSLPAGTLISKRMRDDEGEAYLLNVSQRRDWSDYKHDPVFAKIPAKCDSVSFDTLISRREQMALVLQDSEDEEEDADHSYDGAEQYKEGGETQHQKPNPAAHSESYQEHRSQPGPGYTESEEQRMESEQEERLAALGVSGPPVPVESQEQRIAREQEERLAALGVTGTAKLVRPPVGRAVVASGPTNQYGSSSVPQLGWRAQVSNHHCTPNGSYHDDHHGGNQSTPYGSGYALSLAVFPTNSVPISQSLQRSPLSAFPGFQGSSDNNNNSPAGIRNELVCSASIPNDPHAGGVQTSMSPPQLVSDYNPSRKRSYEQSAEDAYEGARRQEDFAAYRNRHKHPRVADAYNRRW